ncbi:MAG TPA: hypothetical protein VNU97_08130 [Rhizomicrobium sp.]|nr:hypothetical protein [Rhizomicrobium sp.]
MIFVIRFLALMTLLDFAAIIVFMAAMAPYIKPGTRKGSRGLYPMYLPANAFTDVKGLMYRNRFLFCLGMLPVLLLPMAALISQLPEGYAP